MRRCFRFLSVYTSAACVSSSECAVRASCICSFDALIFHVTCALCLSYCCHHQRFSLYFFYAFVCLSKSLTGKFHFLLLSLIPWFRDDWLLCRCLRIFLGVVLRCYCCPMHACHGRSFVCREKRVFLRSNLFDLWTGKWAPADSLFDSLIALVLFAVFPICTRLNSAGGRVFGLYFFFSVFAEEKSTLTLMGGARLHWTIDLWNRRVVNRTQESSTTLSIARTLPLIYFRLFPTKWTPDLNQHPTHTQQKYTHTHTPHRFFIWLDLICVPISMIKTI